MRKHKRRFRHPVFGLWSLLFLCVLCASAVNSFAQTEADTLAEIINRGSVEQKRTALIQLRNLETETASRVAAPALRDKSEIVRATAAASVVYLPPEEAAQVLLPLLNDKSEFVRREAAYALGKTRSPTAILPLLRLLQQNLPRKKKQKEKELEVRGAAAIALGEIGDASAVDSLTRILQTSRAPEEEFLRRAAARSIGQIAQIIQTGESVVITPESFLPDEYKPARKVKYVDLAENFPAFRAAIGVLIQTLQNTREFDDVRRETAFALGAIGDSTAIPVLKTNLNAEDYYLAQISREALKKIER